MRTLRSFLLLAAGLGIIAASFILTLYVVDSIWPDFNGPVIRDRQRAKDIAIIRSGLESYYKSRGVYPNFPDNSVSDLKKDLVEGGFLRAIPNDPSANSRYRYTNQNSDGRSYGLLISLEGEGGVCKTVVGTDPGWWGRYPKCPF